MAWDDQARVARQVQSKLDARLSAYSRMVSDAVRTALPSPHAHVPSAPTIAVDMTGSAPPDPTAMEDEIQALLLQYSEVQTELVTYMNDPMLPASAAQHHAVQRHRELLVEFERDFFRSKTNYMQALDRKQLLGNVKGDIDAYHMQHASEAQAFLSERAHIDSSHRMLDETLGQAYATRDDMHAQRGQLHSVMARMTHVAAQVPGLNNILALIHRRRRRDTVIVAVVIGLCVVVLLMFGTRR
ncbi:protein transport protein gos1 [Malassezia sp. CBS 17886]|nr:protein transport protein gos1 [Malassezia sp. CBS 17886]